MHSLIIMLSERKILSFSKIESYVRVTRLRSQHCREQIHLQFNRNLLSSIFSGVSVRLPSVTQSRVLKNDCIITANDCSTVLHGHICALFTGGGNLLFLRPRFSSLSARGEKSFRFKSPLYDSRQSYSLNDRWRPHIYHATVWVRAHTCSSDVRDDAAMSESIAAPFA